MIGHYFPIIPNDRTQVHWSVGAGNIPVRAEQQKRVLIDNDLKA